MVKPPSGAAPLGAHTAVQDLQMAALRPRAPVRSPLLSIVRDLIRKPLPAFRDHARASTRARHADVLERLPLGGGQELRSNAGTCVLAHQREAVLAQRMRRQ